MNKKTCLFFMVFLSMSFLHPAKIVPLPGHLKPFRIMVEKNDFYITEGPKIFIYSLADFKLKTTFGQAGEGPREFKLPPEFSVKLDIHDDMILASSVGKISFFDASGKFIREKRAPYMNLINMHRLLGDHIVGERLIEPKGIRFTAVYLYDMELNKSTEIHRNKFYLQRGQKFNPIVRGFYLENFYIENSKIFIGGEIGSGAIHVYNQKGDFVQTFKPVLAEVKFTEKDKQGWIDSYMINSEYKRQYDLIKDRFLYPDYFPMFQNFIVADGYIYIQSFNRNDQDRSNEFVILNLQGEVIKKTWLPLVEIFDFTPSPYTIRNNTLFQLAENPETEEWELHMTGIEKNRDGL